MTLTLGFWLLRLFKPGGGWTSYAAKRAGIVALVLAGLLVLGIGVILYNRAIISSHDAKQAAEQERKDLSARVEADRQSSLRADDFASEQAALATAGAEAARSDPTEAAKPVGPVSRSYYDNLPEKRP